MGSLGRSITPKTITCDACWQSHYKWTAFTNVSSWLSGLIYNLPLLLMWLQLSTRGSISAKRCHLTSNGTLHIGHYFNIGTTFSSIAIPIVMTRRCWMQITILVRWHIHIELALDDVMPVLSQQGVPYTDKITSPFWKEPISSVN